MGSRMVIGNPHSFWRTDNADEKHGDQTRLKLWLSDGYSPDTALEERREAVRRRPTRFLERAAPGLHHRINSGMIVPGWLMSH